MEQTVLRSNGILDTPRIRLLEVQGTDDWGLTLLVSQS